MNYTTTLCESIIKRPDWYGLTASLIYLSAGATR